MDNHVLIWGGDLRSRNMVDLKSEMVIAFASTRDLTIDVQSVTGVDLMQLQLICAGNIAAEDLNKKFRLRGLASAVFNNALKEAGWPFLHCRQKMCQARCCWYLQSISTKTVN